MRRINVGFNFDEELPGLLAANNCRYGSEEKSVIAEVYGSVPGIGLGSVRSKSRLKDLPIEKVILIMEELKGFGIEMNYTVNTPNIGTLSHFRMSTKSLQYGHLRNLVERKLITRITVSHPLIMEFLSNDLGVPIEISTVTMVETPGQMIDLKKRAPTIDKICMNINHNRNFTLLTQFMEVCDLHEIKLELLVNEFCTFRCVDRSFCYLLQSCQDHREVDFDMYPHGRCIKKRDNPAEWLKARFILPQWMRMYDEELGIRNFKLTGRTHPTKYIDRMIHTYLSESWKGNLLNLWAHLENIETEKEVGAKYYIPSNELTWDDFIMPSRRWSACDRTCGVTCNYCENYLAEIGHTILR